MRKWFLAICASVILALGFAGCMKGINEQGGKTYKLDPNVVATAEQGTEAGLGILTILGVFWPALLPIATAGAGALATYKKIKPKITNAQTETQIYYNTAASIVAAIEDFKKDNPENWAILKDKLFNAVGENGEAIIRGMRGLPPVE